MRGGRGCQSRAEGGEPQPRHASRSRLVPPPWTLGLPKPVFPRCPTACAELPRLLVLLTPFSDSTDTQLPALVSPLLHFLNIFYLFHTADA